MPTFPRKVKKGESGVLVFCTWGPGDATVVKVPVAGDHLLYPNGVFEGGPSAI